jgi:hypothetical protein
MYKLLRLLVFCILFGTASIPHAATLSSDEPEYPRDSTVRFKAAGSYEQVLQMWKTPEDINEWVAANFSYDRTRAMQLSETQKAKNERPPIYSPLEFFETKTGVCIDLSRFAVETLRRIDPNADPKYLMIEFDPIEIDGNTLRLHWLVSFRRDGKRYFFADSKRPGHIAGPYNDTQTFIKEYEQYRSREIVSYRELDSYQKRKRASSMQQKGPAEK